MKCSKLIGSVVFLCSMLACGGGGGGTPDKGGDSCNALGARVVNGQKIFNGETCNAERRTPVVALVQMSGDEVAGICTGTLITVDDILTSAHCFLIPNLTAVKVVVSGPDEQIEGIDIVSLAVHPLYDGTVGSRYDLAMVTLERTPSPVVGPLPILLSQLTLPGQDMSTFGYGSNNKHTIGELKAVEVKIEDIIEGNLIASVNSVNASVCTGDSGGPVVQVIDGVTAIVGVNSFTFSNGPACQTAPAEISGFVDLQHDLILDFIMSYAPDVSLI